MKGVKIFWNKSAHDLLRTDEVRVTSDLGPEPIKAKIAEGKKRKFTRCLLSVAAIGKQATTACVCMGKAMRARGRKRSNWEHSQSNKRKAATV